MSTLSRHLHDSGDCWSPCVWCYEDDAHDEALAERDDDDDDPA